jgi:parallel beta-helix repeat protein
VLALESRALLSTIDVNNPTDTPVTGQIDVRQAITQANQDGGGDTIDFSSLFDTPQTITLSGGPLVLSSGTTTTIQGPGANLLSVSGNDTSLVFDVVNGGSAALSGLTITGGNADYGGGVRNDGSTLTLTDCTLSGDSATLQGGGLANRFGGTTTLYGCTVSGNSAASGGGVSNLSAGTLSLVDTTISGNTASGQGGGLYNYATAALTNVTVAANSAATGGGLVSSGSFAALTLTNTIVAAQKAGGDIAGALGDGSTHNLIGDGSGMTGVSDGSQGNLVGTAQAPIDPRLAPLGDYGGPTLTMALRAGSPAIGGGGPGASTNDQRGFARDGDGDIGAFQGEGTTLVANTTVDGVGTGPGQLSLRQAVNLANVQDAAATITFGTLFDTSQTITLTAGQLALTSAATISIDGPGPELLSISGDHASRVFIVDSGVTASISGLTITGGNARYGYSGGGLENEGTSTLADVTLSGNSASGNGGGLYNAGGTTTLFDCILSGNSANNNGGGLYNSSGTATLSGCTVTGNSASAFGGGLTNRGGMLSLSDCTISGNSAVGGGGGCVNGGTLSLSDCTISGNSASGNGGGLANGGTLTLTNVTVNGNSASGNGGGLFNDGNASLVNVTVSANSSPGTFAVDTGGSPGILTLFNTIVGGQKAGGDIEGTVESDSAHNLIGDGSGMDGMSNGSQGNQIGTTHAPIDPQLVPLGDYGGPTFTMPLLAGSPAFGAGGTGADVPSTDQRGFARAGRVDVGAFQRLTGALEVNTTTGGVGSSPGQLSLRQAVNLADALAIADSITFSSLFDAPQTITLTAGPVVLTDPATTTIIGPGANLLTVSGKKASRVFEIEDGASAALSGLSITGGRADIGGGLYDNGGALSLSECTISGNTASKSGGGLYILGATTTLTGCTLSGNYAYSGGGLFTNARSFNSLVGPVTLVNCTISGNSAGRGGGLYDFNDFQHLTLTNCTVSANSAKIQGGGLDFSNYSATNEFTNTIIDGNSAGFANDIMGPFVDAPFNLLGNDNAGPPLLAPLGNYGGPTQTMPLLPGSPAIGGGTNASGVPATDQRGLLRTGHVDIGAFQSQGFVIKTVSGSTQQSIPAGKPFQNPLAVTVTANNPVEPVNGGVVSFVANPGSGGPSATLSSATGTISGARAAVNATANAIPGTYEITASASGYESTNFGLSNIETPGVVDVPKPIVVKLTDGLTGLRVAIAYANSHPGPDTIILDARALGARPQTIRLTGGPLVLTDPATTTIIGPGARRLTLSGGGKSRVFEIEGGSLDLSGVTITGGKADRGGGVLNEGGRLALTDVVIQGNRARMGGGLYNDGRTTLSRVLIEGNRAPVDPELFNTRAAKLLWRRSPARARG